MAMTASLPTVRCMYQVSPVMWKKERPGLMVAAGVILSRFLTTMRRNYLAELMTMFCLQTTQRTLSSVVVMEMIV